MANQAAVKVARNTPIEFHDVEVYKPGPHDLLVKNEIISLMPIEARIGMDLFAPPWFQYPSVLGVCFGGSVEAVGSSVKNFQIGDRVAVYKAHTIRGNQYAASQKYALADEKTTSKVPEGVDVTVQVGLLGNLPTVVGLFTGRAGLEKPSLDGSASPKSKKVLIYGGTSSVGSLAVQYVTQAGYSAVTTTSPKHQDLVSKLGAIKVVDHTQDKEAILKALIAEGPYELIVDTISISSTAAITAGVLQAQGGGKLYLLQPPSEPLPEDVTPVFETWPTSVHEQQNAALQEWMFRTYLPEGLASGKLIPLPTEKVGGGLKALPEAFDKLNKGVSGVKLVLAPWE